MLPDVLAMSDAGITGHHGVVWIGHLAPAGTPVEVINKLNTEIVRIIFVKQLRTDTVRLGELIRRAGIQIQ